MNDQSRFQFIGHALQGDGPFRPSITTDSAGNPVSTSETYLIKYPRESDAKFARRNEVAFYASPLARVTGKFTSYISAKKVTRDINQELMKAVLEDTDGKGNEMDVFWSLFMVPAKASGSMLLLVDMPAKLPDNLKTQLEERNAPFWTPVNPALLVEWEIGDDGKFNFASFNGTYQDENGETKDCIWYFDRQMWACKEGDKVVNGDTHPLGECPLLIFTECGDFPCFGPFAPIADISKRLFNLDSELDEILRAQTFSLLTFQVPEDQPNDSRSATARAASEVISTDNMLMHSGNTPAFIAPPDGPASIYMDRIKGLQVEVSEIGLDVSDTNAAESGKAKQIRFQALNSELGKFSSQVEGLERRAWDLTAKWLGMTDSPTTSWPRDFNVADTEQELSILRDMNDTGMSQQVIIAQQNKVVVTQFSSMDMDDQEELISSLNEPLSET